MRVNDEKRRRERHILNIDSNIDCCSFFFVESVLASGSEARRIRELGPDGRVRNAWQELDGVDADNNGLRVLPPTDQPGGVTEV